MSELIYGLNSVLSALKAGRRAVRRLHLAASRVPDARWSELVRLAAEKGVGVERCDASHLDRLTGGSSHQGVVAEVEPVRPVSLEEALEASQGPPLVVVLDHLEDPRNVGAIWRSAAAAGACAVVMAGRRQAQLTAAAQKVAEGAADYVAQVLVANVAAGLERLKQAALWTVGLDPRAGRPWFDVDLTGPVALVVGSEGSGLSRLVRERCDFRVALPICWNLGSINAAAAATVVLYEAVRQRRAPGSALPRDPSQGASLETRRENC